jgi:uncharacterized membrane protein
MRRASDVVIAFGVADVCGAVVLLAPKLAAVRIPATFILVLLTGYVVSRAIFVHRPLAVPEGLVLCLGLSFAVLILGGLVFNLTRWGLTRSSWVWLLIGIVAAAAVVYEVRGGAPLPRGIRPRFAAPGAIGTGLLALAVAVTCAAVLVATAVPAAKPSDGYTVLTLVPGGSASEVRLGVLNERLRATAYRIELRIGRSRVVNRLLTLGTGERWSDGITIPRRTPAGTVVAARLYLASQPASVYRSVHIVLP